MEAVNNALSAGRCGGRHVFSRQSGRTEANSAGGACGWGTKKTGLFKVAICMSEGRRTEVETFRTVNKKRRRHEMANNETRAQSNGGTEMPVAEENVVYFSFSIPNLTGQSPGEHFDLLSNIKQANLIFRGLSGSVYGKRMKIFCAPTDVDKFRDFSRQHRLRAKEHHAINITGSDQMVGSLVTRWALSGFLLQGFSIASNAGGFVV
jgi:hypothetical protein